MIFGLALFSGVLHVYIFCLESLMWGTPYANRAFALKAADAAIMKPFAFNQGFYNLFLAIAIFGGLFMVHASKNASGQLLIDYAMASIFGAGVVLVSSSPNLWIPAMAQALPPLLYGIFRIVQLQRGSL